MTEKQLQLVNYEQAKKLKKLGFDWELQVMYDVPSQMACYSSRLANPFQCINWNNPNEENCISAPTVALALKWFRDVKGVFTSIYNNNMVYCDLEFDYVGVILFDEKRIFTKHYDTYDEAESALLDALLEYYKKEVQDA